VKIILSEKEVEKAIKNYITSEEGLGVKLPYKSDSQIITFKDYRGDSKTIAEVEVNLLESTDEA